MPAKAAKRPHQYVGEQVRKARESRGWNQTQLAERLTELGFEGWRQSKITKIEHGQVMRISLEDVLALAVGLSVQPIHLMAPEGAQVEIAPKLVRTAEEFGWWVGGSMALSAEDVRTYKFGALVPDAEIRDWADVIDRVRQTPRGVRPELDAWMDSLEAGLPDDIARRYGLKGGN